MGSESFLVPPDCEAFRAPILYFLDDPGPRGDSPESYRYFEDGLLVTHRGRVLVAGDARALLPRLPNEVALTAWPDKLLMPGFIDIHVHLPQLEVIASYGGQLLDWLERYTYPAEARLADPAWARFQAGQFLDQLLCHGTTSALVFASSHPVSVEALYEAALGRNMAITAGKVMMDRNAPASVLDEADASYEDSRALIEKWQGQGRLAYAITPRFAPTSSSRQLSLAGKLAAEFPGLLVQTHWAENRAEVQWVRELFPEAASYLDVYDRHGLLGERTILAHGIHIDDEDRRRMARRGARIAFCPTSNTFLGSGLFDREAAQAQGIPVGLASDVGGGTQLSMLATMAEAYRVGQLLGQPLDPLRAYYMSTLGNARVIHRQEELGHFQPGAMADFIVLDPSSSPLLAQRNQYTRDLRERLFAMMILGDDRAIAATYVAGRCLHQRPASAHR